MAVSPARRDQPGSKNDAMSTGAEIVLAVVAAATILVVLALFVWAAIRDGQEDKALQKRLGIRRRTRLGR
jgi:hypothetical protein